MRTKSAGSDGAFFAVGKFSDLRFGAVFYAHSFPFIHVMFASLRFGNANKCVKRVQ